MAKKDDHQHGLENDFRDGQLGLRFFILIIIFITLILQLGVLSVREIKFLFKSTQCVEESFYASGERAMESLWVFWKFLRKSCMFLRSKGEHTQLRNMQCTYITCRENGGETSQGCAYCGNRRIGPGGQGVPPSECPVCSGQCSLEGIFGPPQCKGV